MILTTGKRLVALVLCLLVVFSIFSAMAETRKIQSGYLVRLRQSPSEKSKVLDSFPKGTAVNVLNKGSTWCKVKVKGKTGYMMTQYLYSTTGESGGGGSTMYVWTPSGTTLNLREEANAYSTILGSYRVGTAVRVLRRGSAWSKVSVDGKTGYMFSFYLRNSK